MGNVQAQSALGAMYEKGQGIIKDHRMAINWHNKAAEQGINYAKKALKRLE